MKINIAKLQLGGGLGKLFSATPIGQNSPSTPDTTSTASDDDGFSIIPKETLNKLRTMEYGLPNELDQFEMELADLEYRINAGERPHPREIAEMRAKAGRLVAQAGHLKKAEDHAFQKSALDDIAVDQKGYIYAQTKKGIEKISFSKYNPAIHQALTYGELVEERRQSPQLINDRDVISAIGRATSIEETNKFIYEILDKVKTSKTKVEAIESLKSITGRYAAGQMTQAEYLALKDIATAADIVGLGTFFETSQLHKNSNMQHAYNYIMDILPQNMRAQLEAHYLVSGGQYKGIRKHVGEVIASISMAMTEQEEEYGVKYASGINTANGSGNSTKRDTRKISNLEKLAAGSANRTELEFIVPSATGMKMTFHGSGLPTLYNTKDEMVGPTTVLEAYNSGLRGMSAGKIYFGNREVDEGMLNDFLYDGQAIIKASIPVDVDGVPSFRLLQNLDKVYAEFAKHPEWSLQQKNDYLKQQGLRGYIDEQGNYVGDGIETKDFFIISAYTTKKEANRNYGVLKPNDLAHEIDKNSPEHAALMSRLQSTIAAVNGSRDKNDPKVDIDMRAFQPDGRNPLVSAPLFIQCAPNPAARASEVTGNNPEVDTQYWEESVVKDHAAGKGGPHYDTSKMV